MTAPLNGIKVLELSGLAPAPFAGLILADYGADVVRIDRPGAVSLDTLTRGKKSIALNLKNGDDRDIFIKLVRKADVLIEPYRPGVMESLSLGPDELRKVNAGLIYARLTGFQRSGVWKNAAGHDINYLALSGALSALGTKELPMPPGNILGDFAGGGMTCALGVILALFDRHRTGKGRIVEANMVDGVSYLATFVRHARLHDVWGAPRGENLLDGGCPYYRCYRTKDDQFMAIGALEPQFYKIFAEKFGVSLVDRKKENWDTLRQQIQKRFSELNQAEWCAIYDGTDACVTPVLDDILPTRTPVEVGYANAEDETIGLAPDQHRKQILASWKL